jgi:hypothetical protein
MPGHVMSGHVMSGHVMAGQIMPGHVGPGQVMPGQVMPGHVGPGQRGAAPPIRSSSHTVRSSFDMAAAATHDAMVRRIIWIALLVIAIIAVLIFTH